MNENPTYLNLTSTLRVFRCDDRNFELEEFREVVARPNRFIKEETRSNKWVSVGYYSSIAQAVNGALSVSEANLSANEKMDLETFVVELTKISEELKIAVAESGIKVTDFVKVPDGRGRKAGEVRVAKVTDKDVPKKVAAKKVAKKRGRGRPRKVQA